MFSSVFGTETDVNISMLRDISYSKYLIPVLRKPCDFVNNVCQYINHVIRIWVQILSESSGYTFEQRVKPSSDVVMIVTRIRAIWLCQIFASVTTKDRSKPDLAKSQIRLVHLQTVCNNR